MNTFEEQNGRAAKVRHSMDYETCLDELIGAVESDAEYNTLRQLVHRAGAGWICATNRCRGINPHSESKCCGCDGKRPKLRDVPESEDIIRCSVDYQRRTAHGLTTESR